MKGALTAATGDLKSAAKAAAWALGVASAIELVLTVIAAPSFPTLGVLWRFVAIDVALMALLFGPLVIVMTVAALAVRVAVKLATGQGLADYPGVFASVSATGEISRFGAFFWGAFFFALAFVSASTALIRFVASRFKEPLLTAALTAVVQLALVLAAFALAAAVSAGARRLARALHPRLGAWNPFARALPALVLAFALIVGPGLLLLAKAPHLRPLVPWRWVAFALALAVGVDLAKRHDWPARLRGRRLAVACAVLYLGLVPLTLLHWGAEPAAKALAVTASPPLSAAVDWVRRANDIDRDGYGSLLGESDCAPFNSKIHPLAAEIPDNGRDENCDGRDLEIAKLRAPSGKAPPVPEAFRREWNVLLLTVDTIRYDHTSFGGYIEKRGRDTTPNLAELVSRSASFAFCNAPSAGTMASIPAILTSKFFHSGIALGPDRRGMPPLTKPENLLVAEIFKDAGYQTGAIVTHYYFNDWGLDQGFDTYDNSIGEKSKPTDVSSDILTNRGLSWVAKHSGSKWFLWLHYLDPHGRYVAHPGEKSFGESEEDLYDGELHFTDKHLGRLFRELARIPGVAENTIVVLTSDHGDGFGEHGFINHAQALYRELLWVPLIFYVPSIQPRVIDGPVSPLDIVPTVLDLAGIDRSRFSFEGESLVPQLFYGADARDRVVFSETNWPKPQRAAISNRYKLIRRLQENLFELYDLEADPLEKKNVFRTEPRGFAEMNGHLDEWLERVYYARDGFSNQHMLQLKETLLDAAPTPPFPLAASFEDGAIEIVGFDVAAVDDPKAKKGAERIAVYVYFTAKTRPERDYKIQVLGWALKNPGDRRVSPAQFTANGTFPSSRWRAGEFIRHEAQITTGELPSGTWEFALKLSDEKATVVPVGLAAAKEPGMVLLGQVELSAGKALTPKDNAPNEGSSPVPAP